MSGMQVRAGTRIVRQRGGDHDALEGASIEARTVLVGEERAARRVDPGWALFVEMAVVAGVVTGVGWAQNSSSWTVAAVLGLVLVTLYHSGHQVVRQGLPHLGRIVRDMAIPVALMAFAVQLGLPGHSVLGHSITMVGAGMLTAVGATVVRRRSSGRVRVLAVGSAEGIARAALQWAGHRKIDLVGAVTIGEEDRPVETFGVPVTRGLGTVVEQAETRDAELVVALAGPQVDSEVMRRLSWSLEGSRSALAFLSALDFVAPHRIETAELAGATLVHVAPGRPSALVRLVKSTLDRVVAAVALVLLAPLLGALVLAVRAGSRGPGIFKQTRIGKDGKPFTLLKLRSMCQDADAQKASLQDQNERDVLFKIKADPRVTPLGRILRRTSLDELPQLLNVLRGDMSLIGPRPSLPEEVAQYDDVARRRLVVRPGITGLSQVSGRANLSWGRTVELDVRYTDNWRLADDVTIGLRTVRAVVSSKGAY